MHSNESIQLRERNARLALLARVSQQLVFSHGAHGADRADEPLLRSIFQQLADALGYELFFHFKADDSGRALRLAACAGLTPDERERYAVLTVGEPLCGTVASRRQPVIAEDLPRAAFADVATHAPTGLHCYAGIPLLADGVLVGTVAFATRLRTHLKEGEVQLLQTVCDLAAGHLARVHNARRLRECERRLRDHEAQVQLAMQASLSIGFEWDIVRDRVRRLQSAEPARPETMDSWETFEDRARSVHPFDRESFWTDVSAAMASPTGIYRSTFRVVHSDGTIRWLSESGRVERDAGGRPARLIGISQDVTDRKITADELRAQEEFTRRVTDVAPSILYVFDLDEDRNVWGNREMYAVLGYARDEIQAFGRQQLQRVLHPDDAGRYREHAERLTQLGDDEVAEVDVRMRHADGSWRWLHSREMVFRRSRDGRPRQVVGSALDITERKQEERHVTFLTELNDAFAPARRSDEIAEIALGRIADHFGASRVNLSDVNGAQNTITVCFSRHAPGLKDDRQEHHLDDYLSGDVIADLAAGRIVAIADVATDARTAPQAAAYDQWKIGALMLAPYVSDGRWLFLIVLHKEKPYAWHALESALLREVAERVHIRLQRARVEEALLGAHATFRHLVDQSPFGVYVVDADFRLVQVSAGAQRVFQNVRPLLGRDFAEVMRLIWPEPFATEVVAQFRHTLTTGQPYHAPSTVERRGDIGVVESYDWKIERITLPDGRPGVVCHFYDLSERQRYESALRAADRQKDEFLAMLAHELRNPLAPIRASVGVLRSKGSSDALVARCRDVIDRQAALMARLLDDLLDVSRLSRGRLTLQRGRVVLRDVLDAAVETSRPLIDQQKQTLRVQMPHERILIDGDSARLTQVFANLLNNAAKYGDRGGEIDVQTVERSGQVIVNVRDTGIGIAADMLDRIFDLFAQDGDAKTHAPGGLGIGLSLAKKLVDMHGGTLTASSLGPGRGSEFAVALPMLQATHASTSDALPQPLDGPASSRRVLVADDNMDAADTTALLLEALGCTVKTVYGGEAAVRDAEEFRPDLVLLDLGMPEVDGYEACRRIRRHPWSEGMMIVAVSGWGQDSDRQQSASVGFDRHLLKPVEAETFARLVRESQTADRTR